MRVRRAALLILLVSTFAVACRAGPTPSGSLAGPTNPSPPAGASPSSRAPDPSSGGQPVGPSATATTGGSPASDPEPRPFHSIGTAVDAGGDGGAQARPYEDIIGVVIQDDGERARILVRLGAAVPDPMPEGEQMGIGVDLFRRAASAESDFQVYAAGDDEGWLAFFQTPQGPARYPGGFAIGDDILEFTIPWSALGELRGERFSGFLDWDRDSIAVNLAGHDAIPDEGRAAFSR